MVIEVGALIVYRPPRVVVDYRDSQPVVTSEGRAILIGATVPRLIKASFSRLSCS